MTWNIIYYLRKHRRKNCEIIDFLQQKLHMNQAKKSFGRAGKSFTVQGFE